MKAQVVNRVQRETAERRAAAQRDISQEHRDLLLAIDECLDDPDPKVVRAAKQVAQECLADARASRMQFLGMGNRRAAETARLEVSDFHRRAR